MAVGGSTTPVWRWKCIPKPSNTHSSAARNCKQGLVLPCILLSIKTKLRLCSVSTLDWLDNVLNLMIYLVFRPSPRMVECEFFTSRPCWQLAMSNFCCEVLAKLFFLLWGVIHPLVLFWWLLLFLFQWLLMLLAVCSRACLRRASICLIALAPCAVPTMPSWCLAWIWPVWDICLVMSVVSVSPHLNATFVAPIFLTLVAVWAENP